MRQAKMNLLITKAGGGRARDMAMPEMPCPWAMFSLLSYTWSGHVLPCFK